MKFKWFDRLDLGYRPPSTSEFKIIQDKDLLWWLKRGSNVVIGPYPSREILKIAAHALLYGVVDSLKIADEEEKETT